MVLVVYPYLFVYCKYTIDHPYLLFLNRMKATRYRRGIRDLVSIGLLIKSHRLKCGVTHEFLAEKLGITRWAVSRWERGLTAPSIDCVATAQQLEMDAANSIELRRLACTGVYALYSNSRTSCQDAAQTSSISKG